MNKSKSRMPLNPLVMKIQAGEASLFAGIVEELRQGSGSRNGG
ncbi:hypothetical protein [Paenibacillus sacheonensis]|nr:hypothetical protein [Paenibacillus sacheonensis]MBM7566681.1 hypothetical protein [Paenibacillus sacheonensis]